VVSEHHHIFISERDFLGPLTVCATKVRLFANSTNVTHRLLAIYVTVSTRSRKSTEAEAEACSETGLLKGY
jgi:hypothetical protein